MKPLPCQTVPFGALFNQSGEVVGGVFGVTGLAATGVADGAAALGAGAGVADCDLEDELPLELDLRGAVTTISSLVEGDGVELVDGLAVAIEG